MPELQREVERFKQWASSFVRCSAEWECEYEHWPDLLAAAREAIATHRDGRIPASIADDLLYALGRDNECESIREGLLESPELIATLAKRALLTDDADAKWQIAISVAEAELLDAAELLRPFLTDSDEYVRRRSLMAIAPFAPSEAEAIAIKNLDDEFEYTRIMALHVLHRVRSRHLEASLERLASDSSEHVRTNVEKLRVAQRDSLH